VVKFNLVKFPFRQLLLSLSYFAQTGHNGTWTKTGKFRASSPSLRHCDESLMTTLTYYLSSRSLRFCTLPILGSMLPFQNPTAVWSVSWNPPVHRILFSVVRCFKKFSY
jgi:hypothetical protein